MGLTVALTGLHMGESPQPGFGVLRSLRRSRPDIEIVGLAYDVLESGVYADDGPDAVYTLPYPSAGARAFLERFDHVLARHDVKAFMPTLDAEIHPMLALVPELEKRGVKTCLPTPAMFARRNKSNLPVLLRECGAQTPVTHTAHNLPAAQAAAAGLGYPVMLKGQYYDAYKVYSAAHLAEKYADLVAHWGTPVLVQACVAGSEFNVIGVGDGEGGIAASCSVRKTIVSSKGKGYGAIVVRDPVLEETCARIVRHLKWRGPFELEYIKDDRQRDYQLIEMNPRFPAWVDFPSSFGWNLPELLLDYMLGGRMRRLPAPPPGKFFIRHCADLTGDVADLGLLSSTGEWRKNSAAPAPA